MSSITNNQNSTGLIFRRLSWTSTETRETAARGASTSVNEVENAKFVANALSTLKKADSGLVTQKNIDALINSKEKVQAVAKGLSYLYKHLPTRVTQKNFDAIIRSGEHAEVFAKALSNLYKYARPLVSSKNLEILINSGANAGSIATTSIDAYLNSLNQHPVPLFS